MIKLRFSPLYKVNIHNIIYLEIFKSEPFSKLQLQKSQLRFWFDNVLYFLFCHSFVIHFGNCMWVDTPWLLTVVEVAAPKQASHSVIKQQLINIQAIFEWMVLVAHFAAHIFSKILKIIILNISAIFDDSVTTNCFFSMCSV